MVVEHIEIAEDTFDCPNTYHPSEMTQGSIPN